MTDLDLDAIRAREQAATPAPWVIRRYPHGGGRLHDEDERNLIADLYDVVDREFIAHARTDIPALIAAVQRRDDALAAVLALCDEWEAAYRRIFQTPAQLAAFGGSMPVVQVDADEVRDAITAHLTPADSPTTED